MLTGGDYLGPYEIVSLLGTGGMGEVYRATDKRLRRDVAIKVLPSAFSRDPERLQRFEQEALASARLNHPNIVAVYDVGAHELEPYVVSELLEGETLRAVLANGPLPLTNAIEYSTQMADGLAAAHEKGIVHRDVKPENTFVMPDGRIKILDFGIAKLKHPVDTLRSDGQTTLARDTTPGVVLGTVGYMSPEQIRGLPVDHRSDIFSLGAILYEMVTGRRAFLRDSSADTVAAILKDDPISTAASDPQIPVGLPRIIQHCLEKAPERRFQSARDLAFALEAVASNQASNARPAPAIAGTRGRLRAAIGAAAIALLVLFGVLASQRMRSDAGATDAQPVQFAVPAPAGSSIETVSFSPDGRFLAFAATSDQAKRLWLRPMNDLSARALAGTEEVSYHFWSPDSRFIGFFAQGKLKRLELANGTVQAICNATNARGGTWGRDGAVVFASGPGDGLYRVSAEGGSATPVTTLSPARQESSHRWPFFLPDGRHFVFYVRSGRPEHTGIYLGSVEPSGTKRLVGAVSNAAYVAPGYLVFLRGDTLLAQAFDAEELTLRGDAYPILNGLAYDPGVMRADFALSNSNMLAYRAGGTRKLELHWVDRGGRTLKTVGVAANHANVALSPDDLSVAAGRWDSSATSDVWVMDAIGGSGSRLTFMTSSETHPVWSPDRRWIAFASDREGLFNIYRKSPSGSGSEETVVASNAVKYPTHWSADNRFIVYDSVDAATKLDIWALPLFGDRKPSPFLQTEFDEWQGQVSPDGRWIAYTSNESGRYEVYVQSFPFGGGKWQVSTGGGLHPTWRGDGKELFYIAAGQMVMAVGVHGADDFKSGSPAALFEARIPNVFATRSPYAVTRDGKRFLMTVDGEAQSSVPITVILNWPALLTR